ncbi:MAG: ABC transporter ATP-binding protein [Corynebacteriales bacterium]|nr:ABC transporter ATP-binding protein [Mycobacteriales bacterium]
MTEPANPPVAFKAILAYAKPHKGTLLLGGLLATGGSIVGLAQPLAATALVDRLSNDKPLAAILIGLTALVLIGATLSALGSFVLERTAESVVRAARTQLISRILRLKVSEVERTEPGDLMARVTSDTTLLRQVTTHSMVNAFTGSITVIGSVILMAFMDLVLLSVTAIAVVTVSLSFAFVMPKIRKATTAAQAAVGDMGSSLERVLGALRTVKASGAEEREERKLAKAADEAWHQGVRVAKWGAVAGTSAWLTVQISFLAVLGVGGARVASGATDVATLVGFLLFLFYLLYPLGQLVQAVKELQVGSAAISRIQAVEDMAAEPHKELTRMVPAPGSAAVAFRDVEFAYRPELAVHHGVSFAIPSGGMTAFVGPSGAGKSTVFSLIERFYEPTAGKVLLDGKDVRDWPLADLRAAIGYVEQDAPVLSGTLRENLTFAAPQATEDEIHDVLRRTRLEALIARLPDGLETVVGHRGSRLSGGERQRVAIARALLRKPRLLLLDEATSQLDAVNELALRDVIADVASTTTVLVVAHRLSTVTMADRIIVMEAGKVRAMGSHTDLISVDALYAELAATQFLTAA